MRVTWVALFLFAGCKGGDDTEVIDTDTDTDVDSESDSDSDTDEDTLGASLTGTVKDVDGNVVPSRVNVCRDVCKTKSTDASGKFAYDDIEPWTASFYVVPMDVEGPYATPMVPATLAKGANTLDVVMPKFTAKALPATHSFVSFDGIDLNIGLDVLEEPTIGEIGDKVTVARPAAADRLPVEITGTTLDMWYIGPFEIESGEGVEVRLTGAASYGLSEGDTVDLYESSLPIAYKWDKVGTLTYTGGALTGTAKLTILTTLVVVKP